MPPFVDKAIDHHTGGGGAHAAAGGGQHGVAGGEEGLFSARTLEMLKGKEPAVRLAAKGSHLHML